MTSNKVEWSLIKSNEIRENLRKPIFSGPKSDQEVTKKWPRMNTFFWSFLDVKRTTGPAGPLGFVSGTQGRFSYNFFGLKKSVRISWKIDEKLSWPWGTKKIRTVDGHLGRPCIQANGIRDLTCLNRRALFYSGKWHLPEYKVAPEAWFLIIIPGGIVTAWEKLRQCRRHREAEMQSVYSPVNLQARAAEEQETWKIMKFSNLHRNGAMLYNLIFRAEKPRKNGVRFKRSGE